MAAATVSLLETTAHPPRAKRPRGHSVIAAAVLSILGSAVAIGIAAVGLLVVPVAALIVFGPSLLELM